MKRRHLSGSSPRNVAADETSAQLPDCGLTMDELQGMGELHRKHLAAMGFKDGSFAREDDRQRSADAANFTDGAIIQAVGMAMAEMQSDIDARFAALEEKLEIAVRLAAIETKLGLAPHEPPAPTA